MENFKGSMEHEILDKISLHARQKNEHSTIRSKINGEMYIICPQWLSIKKGWVKEEPESKEDPKESEPEKQNDEAEFSIF